jgi:hypothetical protein
VIASYQSQQGYLSMPPPNSMKKAEGADDRKGCLCVFVWLAAQLLSVRATTHGEYQIEGRERGAAKPTADCVKECERRQSRDYVEGMKRQIEDFAGLLMESLSLMIACEYRTSKRPIKRWGRLQREER